MALHVIFPVKGFCYGWATPHPYPVRSLPAQLWHRCMDGVLCGPQHSQFMTLKLLAEPRFEPGSPSWDAGALTTTPRAHAWFGVNYKEGQTVLSSSFYPTLIYKILKLFALVCVTKLVLWTCEVWCAIIFWISFRCVRSVSVTNKILWNRTYLGNY